MSLPRDPYDKKRVLDALVDHAWSDKNADHKIAFRSMGIQTKEQLRDLIEKSIEGSDTRVFKAQPVKEKGQTLPREVYELPLCNAEGCKPVVILNPGRDRAGRLAGGTCYVPGKDGKSFDQVFEQDKDVHTGLKTGHTLEIIQGGRPSLRKQEQHQQVSTEVRSTGSADPAVSEPENTSDSYHAAISDDFLRGAADWSAQHDAQAERGPDMDTGLDR